MNQQTSISTEQGQQQGSSSAASSTELNPQPYFQTQALPSTEHWDPHPPNHIIEELSMTRAFDPSVVRYLQTEPLVHSRFITYEDTGINWWKCKYCFTVPIKHEANGNPLHCEICNQRMVTATHLLYLDTYEQMIKFSTTGYTKRELVWFCDNTNKDNTGNPCENQRTQRKWTSERGRRCSKCFEEVKSSGWSKKQKKAIKAFEEESKAAIEGNCNW